MHEDNILVVGSGPAGLMAASAAARAFCTVRVLERMPRPGLKLLASGGGRCNLTNTLGPEAFMKAFGRDGRFLEPALRLMGPLKLRAFLTRLGVPTFSPDGFHVFPVAQTSRVVLDAMIKACTQARVTFHFNTPVHQLIIRRGRVAGVRTERGEELRAGAVVLATGGKTYPQLSGTELGYNLAKQADHTVTPLFPALVGLTVQESWPRACAGASLRNAEIHIDSPPRRRVSGDVLFTHRGLSGPAVLNLSRDITPALAGHSPVVVRLRLALAPKAPAWAEQWEIWRRARGRKTVRALLDELLPATVAKAILHSAGVAPHAVIAQLGRKEQVRLAALLERAPLTVVGSDGDFHAMVTRGGVSLKEVDPHTLQSRLVQGLFFAGEMLDLDGPCGGFNLQWAFASGWLAGCSAATCVGRTARSF